MQNGCRSFSEGTLPLPAQTNTPPRLGDRRPLLAAAALLTTLALLALLAVSQPPPDPPPPAPVQVDSGPWAGWWLDNGWSVAGDGALVGAAPAVPRWDQPDAYLRYAFPPQASLPPDFLLRFNLTPQAGTLYLGLWAAWHPATGAPLACDSLVFPLQERLSGPALARRACRLAGLRDAAPLARPLLDVTQYGFPPAVTVVARAGWVQLFLGGSLVYEVAWQGTPSGSLYLALEPGARVRLTDWTLEPQEPQD